MCAAAYARIHSNDATPRECASFRPPPPPPPPLAALLERSCAQGEDDVDHRAQVQLHAATRIPGSGTLRNDYINPLPVVPSTVDEVPPGPDKCILEECACARISMSNTRTRNRNPPRRRDLRDQTLRNSSARRVANARPSNLCLLC